MSRGRPRKKGDRYPGGQLKRENARGSIYWQRERDALRLSSRDPYLATPIGRLFRAEKITSTQMDAGVRFAEARALADAALGLPPRSARAQDLAAVHGLAIANDDPDVERRRRRDIAAYDRAEEAVGLGSEHLRVLQWVVIYEQGVVGHAELLVLVEALARLARHYGLAR